jgi:heme-degrading monooxygenase HmoA
MYIIIWQFIVKPGRGAEFEQAYGPAGKWVELFRQADGYSGTELLRHSVLPRHYITIDRWVSEAAYEAFRSRHADAYAAIDRRCEGLTEQESEWGRWVPLPFITV